MSYKRRPFGIVERSVASWAGEVFVIAVIAGSASGCGIEEIFGSGPPAKAVSVQEVRAVRGNGHNYLSVDVLATDEGGLAIPCGQGSLDVEVSIATAQEGPFTPVSDSVLQVRCTAEEGADIALVVDNSQSERNFLPWLQEAAKVMVDGIRQRGGRASLVRVSTEATVRQPLTDDDLLIHNAIDGLFIRNGWTALYDGVRLGNETLGDGAIGNVVPADLDSFCAADRKLGIVTFTDGQENNSSNQSYLSDEYPGDGLDTTLEDLYRLQVSGVTTPIYTVGLGREVERDRLTSLAEYTGGRHHQVDDEADLPGVFQMIANYLESNVKVCTELPTEVCGELWVRVDYVWSSCIPGDTACDENGVDAEVIQGTQVQRTYLECPHNPRGNSATILLTMSDPNIPQENARTLAENAVTWVSPVLSPRVLVVKDDNHHDEASDDAVYVATLLEEANYDVTFIDEPPDGLVAADVAGYDVVWLSNPGYPVDDKTTLDTLASLADQGGGYILQGDDMTWFWGDAGFSMTPYTGLVHESNGDRFCDWMIDNYVTENAYRVDIGDSHPVISGLEGLELVYGDDIDTSYPADQGETVLAQANGLDGTGSLLCSKTVPVITVRTP